MTEKIKQSAEFISERINLKPETGIILGSGLGGLASGIEQKQSIPYSEIPNFPVSTVEGHSGRLIAGKLGGKNVLAMQGRFHYYEGYDMKQLTFPIRVMHFLGIKNLIVSNAAGGLNPEFEQGDLMLITDHINFFPENPLRGKNMSKFGVRFPDMSKVYNQELIQEAEKIAAGLDVEIRKGVYIGSQGPTLETPAEYKMFRILGADATGMSTVPEVIAAHHQGMKIFGMSVITNIAEPEHGNETTHDEVQDVAGKMEPKLTELVKQLLNKM